MRSGDQRLPDRDLGLGDAERAAECSGHRRGELVRGFDNPDDDGLVESSGDVRGGHEFEIVGVDLENELFHAVNSWGGGWGKEGSFWFSFDTMSQLLGEDGDCTQLFPPTVPSPTPTPTPDVTSFPGALPDVDQRIQDAARLTGHSVSDWQNSHYLRYFRLT